MFPFMRDVRETPLDDGGGLRRRFTDPRNSSYVITRVFDSAILYMRRGMKSTTVHSSSRMNISRRILDFRKMDDVKLILFVSSLQKKRIPTYIYIYISLFRLFYDCFRIIFRKFTRKIQ